MAIPKNTTDLTAITPLDGRYKNKTEILSSYVSEIATIKLRLDVEIKYLFALEEQGIIRKFNAKEKSFLTNLAKKFSLEDAVEIKEIEVITRHDVKALERWVREKLLKNNLSDIVEFFHFGITSWDINNIVHALQLKSSTNEVLLPILKDLLSELLKLADKYKDISMLARTHGQAAVPTTLGKELVIFAERLSIQIEKLEKAKLTAKFNGAVGNYNALSVSFPDIDWIEFSKRFVESFDLEFSLSTNQINPYDSIAEYLQIIQRINNILINLDQDYWRYISDDWFVQENVKGEVGSSTMPQKVNPIDFENSEGNLGLANSVLQFFVQKLSISRLQRDLSDSTVMRNLGVVVGYSLIGYKSTINGLSRTKPNIKKIDEELNRDWTILGEGAQTILRKSKTIDPYSLISSLTRGQHINEKEWKEFVINLPIDKKNKESLKKIKPNTYVGEASTITKKAIREIKKRNGLSN